MSHPMHVAPASYRPLNSQDDFRRPLTDFSRKLDASDNEVDQIHLRKPPSSFRRFTLRFWLTEWLSWLFALGCIIGIVIILVVFKGRPIPDWPFGITLGALISLLATVATVALMVPIGSGMGQAQWIWFTSERCFKDFYLIDEASRGLFGAIWLLVRWKGGLFALTGALLTILVLGIAPFAQQVIKFVPQTLDSPSASIPVVFEYDNSIGGPAATDVDLSMKAAIQRGLLDIDATSKTFLINPQCSTGNCIWKNYATLSVCAQCADLSSDLNIVQTEQGELIASLPNNVSIKSIPETTQLGFISMTVNSTWGPSFKFPYARPLLDVFTIISQYGNGTENIYGPYASECVLLFCASNHSSASVNGLFTEVATDEPWYFDADSSYQINTTVSGRNYFVEFDTLKAAAEYLGLVLFSSVVSQSDGSSPAMLWPDDVSQSIFYWTNISTNHLPTNLFENIAASMSQNLRLKSNESSPGVVHSSETIVSVDWPWMILPFVDLVLVLCYLLGIVLVSKSKDLQPWKSNILAPLMHGLVDDESRKLVGRSDRLEEMEALAETLMAKSVYARADKQRNRHVGVSLREA